MAGRRGRVAGPGQGQAEAEARIGGGRAAFHDPAEALGGRGIPAGVELRAGERLGDAARGRLGGRRALEKLRRGRGVALLEQLKTAAVPGGHVPVWRARQAGRGCWRGGPAGNPPVAPALCPFGTPFLLTSTPRGGN